MARALLLGCDALGKACGTRRLFDDLSFGLFEGDPAPRPRAGAVRSRRRRQRRGRGRTSRRKTALPRRPACALTSSSVVTCPISSCPITGGGPGGAPHPPPGPPPPRGSP